MNNTLHLPLLKKWYEMIERGEKTEEYREIKEYWIKRLCFTKKDNPTWFCTGTSGCEQCFHESPDEYTCYPFERVVFSCGYTKRRMTFEVESIEIGFGKREWGANPYKEEFIIKLGRRIEK